MGDSHLMDRGGAGTPTGSEGESATYQLGAQLDPKGNVHEAFHRRFDEQIVVKLFPQARAAPSDAVRSFAREAGRVSILRHPHIARVLDSGIFVDRTPFLAMERLPGTTLEKRLEAGPLPLPQLLPVLRGIVSALTAAHSAGVFHREIRPDNIFLVDHADGGAGVAKVLDFGVAHLTWGAGALTAIDDGAARYIAPEQVHGGLNTADVRTDVFSLAAVTYRMLSGNHAFPTGITVDALDAWDDHIPRPIIPSLHGVSALDAVLYKALDLRPDERYPSVAAFFRAFEEALANAEPAQQAARPRRAFFRKAADSEELAPAPAVATAIPVVAPAAAAPTATTLTPDVEPRDDRQRSTGDPRRRRTGSTGPTVRLRSTSHKLVRGPSLTQEFFDQGEEFERTRWENAPAVAQEDLPASRPEFTSFNRIPRRRAPLLIVLAIVLLVAGTFALPRLGAPSPRALWASTRVGQTFQMFQAGLPWKAYEKGDKAVAPPAAPADVSPSTGAVAATAESPTHAVNGVDPSNLAPVSAGAAVAEVPAPPPVAPAGSVPAPVAPTVVAPTVKETPVAAAGGTVAPSAPVAPATARAATRRSGVARPDERSASPGTAPPAADDSLTPPSGERLPDKPAAAAPDDSTTAPTAADPAGVPAPRGSSRPDLVPPTFDDPAPASDPRPTP